MNDRIVLGENAVYPRRLASGRVLLIDAGLDYDAHGEESWDALVRQAATIGFAPPEVSDVVITHAHIDHAGLAPRWAALGARIFAGGADVDAVAMGRQSNEAQRAVRLDELRRHGCPESTVARLAGIRGRRGLRWDPCPREALTPAEGARFALAAGAAIEVLPAPGHTPGNVVAWDEQRGELYTGDTLLPTTIPTPGLHFLPAEAPGASTRWHSLPRFLDSVATLAALPVKRILPGHGDPVEAPRALFERFAAHHARRASRIISALDGRAATAYEVARTLFRRLPEERIAQAMTEVIGHLDVLQRDGRARLAGEAPWRYELTSEVTT